MPDHTLPYPPYRNNCHTLLYPSCIMLLGGWFNTQQFRQLYYLLNPLKTQNTIRNLCLYRGQNKSAEFGYFRQCGTVFYLVRYGAVRCIHLVILHCYHTQYIGIGWEYQSNPHQTTRPKHETVSCRKAQTSKTSYCNLTVIRHLK